MKFGCSQGKIIHTLTVRYYLDERSEGHLRPLDSSRICPYWVCFSCLVFKKEILTWENYNENANLLHIFACTDNSGCMLGNLSMICQDWIILTDVSSEESRQISLRLCVRQSPVSKSYLRTKFIWGSWILQNLVKRKYLWWFEEMKKIFIGVLVYNWK